MASRSPLDPLHGIIPTDAKLKMESKRVLLERLFDLAHQLADANVKISLYKKENPDTKHVVIDAQKQEVRCDRCKATHPLADGVNNREVWFATGVMKGFTDAHKDCQR